jgi:PPOX class probable F420-dependent enzyme
VSPRLADAPSRFAAARVARLATVNATGTPHLVPVVFAVVGEAVWSAVDAKPKSTTALRRLANVLANPAVSLLVDHYADDWSRLWWVRADGRASVLALDGSGDSRAEEPDPLDGLDALVSKYPQYRKEPPPGPLLRVHVTRWASWSAR